MRRHLFAVTATFLALAAALLVWLWATDFVLIDKCQDAGGAWDKSSRSCQIQLSPVQP